MKLHLPKSLLVAVLACYVAPASWANTKNLDGTNVGADLDLTNTWDANGTFIRAADGTAVTDSIGTLTIASDLSKVVIAGTWNSADSYFESLTIGTLKVGDGTGNVNLEIGTVQGNNTSVSNVIINSVEGTLSSVNNAGNLTLGSVTMGGDITNSGTLNLRGELSGTGTITNSGGNAKLNVDLSAGYAGFDGVVYTFANGSTTGKSGFVRGNQTLRVLNGVTYSGEVYVNNSDTSTTFAEGGYITANVGDSTVFRVDDTWDYNSEQSAGATSFEVSSAGVLIFAGSSTAAGGMTINSNGAVTMSAETTLTDTVTINGGSFNNASQKINGGKLVLNGLSSATIGGASNLSVSLELTNTYLTIGAGDTFDYGDSSALTFKIGTGATLDVQSYRQSVSSSHIIEMAGGTLKGTGSAQDGVTYGIDFYNGGGFNTSADSRIETNVGGHMTPTTGDRYNIQFDVNTGVTLTMTGNLVGETTFSKTAGGTMVYSGAGFTQALTIGGGVFEYNFSGNREHTGSISGTGTLRKSGNGTLVLNSAASVSNIDITGGHLTFGGEDVTHAIDGEIKSSNGSGSSTFKVAAGSTLNAGHINNAYGMTMVVDGILNITGSSGLFLKSNSTETISGAGSIETTKIELGNWDSNYTFSLDSLKVGTGGIVFENYSGLVFSIEGTDVEVAGAVNAQNGTMVLKNGSLSLGASESNYINKFKYVNGALTHTALTIKDAEFSGQTLVNTGTLTLNGVVNVTDTRNLLKGEGVYSDAENGNGFFNGKYYIIKGEEGSTLAYGDNFAVQHRGTAVGTETVDNGTSDLLISLEDTSTYYVNKGTVIFAGENATADTDKASSFVVKSGATLQLGGDVASAVTVCGDGTLALVSGTSAMPANVQGISDAEKWTGVVRMSNATVSAFNINSYGHADSYLELIGVNGWLENTSSAKLTGLILSKSEDGTLNGFTVTDSSSQTYNFNGKVKGDGDFTIATKSNNNVTFAFNGDLSEFAGGIKVEAGDNGSTPTIGINLAGGGDIFAAESNGGVHVNRGGTVNLNIGKSGETTNMRGAVINEGAGTLNVTVQGDTAFKAAVDASKMTLNSGVGVTLGNGANRLTYDLGTVVAHSGGNTITLEQGATLNAFTKGSGSGAITLTGSGVYDLGNAQKTYNTDSTGTPKVNENNNFTLASEWTGTVRIVGAVHQTNKLGLNLNNLSNPNSAVELINVNGWFTDTMAGKLILTEDEAKNAAWIISNGSSEKGGTSKIMSTFNGAVSGNGTMKYAWAVAQNNEATYTGFKFNGDISDWEGAFVMDVNNSLTNFNFVLGTDASEVNAAIGKSENNTGELHLKVERTDTTTFNNTVEVDTLTTSGGAVHFNEDVTVEDTVTAGGTLHVEDGTFVARGTLNAAEKAVELSGSYSNNAGTEGKSTAKLRLEGEGNKVGTFDFGKTGYARGVLELGAESDTTAGALYMNKDVSISMEKGAQLIVGSSSDAASATTSMTAVGDSAGISIDNDATAANTRGQFTHTNNTKYVLSGMDVAINYSKDLTSKYRYNNSSVSNIGSAKLTLNNAANALTGLKAIGGNIDVLNKESMSLQELKVATSLTVGAYTGSGEDSGKTDITVMECVEFGASATLNANLTVATGTTVTLNGYGETASMVDGNLTFHSGLTLAGSVMDALEAMQVGDSLAIFKEVSAMMFAGNTSEAAIMTLSESALTEVDASIYFSNLETGNYLLVFNEAEQTVSIQATVPEPTTATLSLLALAALASRRRRASR